jgi:hypothetical protein
MLQLIQLIIKWREGRIAIGVDMIAMSSGIIFSVPIAAIHNMIATASGFNFILPLWMTMVTILPTPAAAAMMVMAFLAVTPTAAPIAAHTAAHAVTTAPAPFVAAAPAPGAA